MRRALFLQLPCYLFLAFMAVAQPVRLLLDTDIGNDIDDTLALAMIHAMQSRGEVELLGVTVTKDNPYAAPFVDLLNTFYGRPEIPVGAVRDGKTRENSDMIKVPAERRTSAGAYLYPHKLTNGRSAPEAVLLLTHLLSWQPDASVSVVQIGFSTNLARLVSSPGGRNLVAKKVKQLYVMGGNFVEPKPEYNIYTDPEAAESLLQAWPTPILFSGYEIGLAVTFPYNAVANSLEWTKDNPVADACRLFFRKPENRPAWDPTAVLAAVRPDKQYFRVSSPGRVKLGPKNTTVLIPDPSGNCRFLIVDPAGAKRAQHDMIELLTTAPPKWRHG
jgi:inosine-uridine nucleoside N-ribohydrolase